MNLAKCYYDNNYYANIHVSKKQETKCTVHLKKALKMFGRKTYKNIISVLLITNLFAQACFCSNIDELKSERIRQTTGKFSCSCEYRLNSINIGWWENFSDPYLKDYIFQTITKNHDLKQAALKSEEYRQMVRTTFSKELPTLTLAPTFARIKTARNQIGDFEFAQTRTNIYAIPLAAIYEADIFLKNHNKTKSSKMEKNAVEYEEKAANIIMASEVATLYINIIKLDKIIETQQKITDIREKIFLLTKDRNKAGLASVYDVTYTDKLHTQAQIDLNDLMRQRSLYLHQLAVYIDESPCCASSLKRGKFDELEYNGQIPDCISSEVTSMRPDIMKIEAELKRAKIDITVAKKEFLPTIPILGVAGYNSLLLKRLFDWKNIMALVGVAAFEKIYTGGYLMANLRIKKVQFEQLLEAYKQADLTALQEINDSLCMIKFDTKKDNDNLRKVKLEKSNLTLIHDRFKAGITSYLDYIQYEETLLSLQTEQDNSKAQRLIDYITLYKATGTKL